MLPQPGGERLLTWGTRSFVTDEFVRCSLWSLKDGSLLATFPHEAWIRGAAFDPLGKVIVTWAEDDVLKLWALDDGRLIAVRTLDQGVQEAVFHPSGEWLLIRGGRVVSLWKLPRPPLSILPRSAALKPQRVFTHEATVHVAMFHPDGKRLITCSDDHTARVWKLDWQDGLQSVLQIKNLHWNSRGIRPVGAKHILTGNAGDGDPVRLWSLKKKASLWSSRKGEKIHVRSISPDAEYFLTVDYEHKELQLRRVGQNELVLAWKTRNRKLSVNPPDGLFLADGRLLVWHDTDLDLWDVHDDSPIRVWGGDFVTVKVIPHPDGERVIVQRIGKRTGEGQIEVLSLETGNRLRTIPHEGDVTTTWLSPNGQELFVESYRRFSGENSGAFWLLSGGPPRLRIPELDVDHVQLDGEGKLLLGWSEGAARAWLWSTESGQVLKQFHHPDAKGFDRMDLRHFHLDPRGRFIVSHGGRPHSLPGQARMKIWEISDLSQPVTIVNARSYFKNVIPRDDGTIFLKSGGQLQLFSSSGYDRPLRVTKPFFGGAIEHPDGDGILAISTQSELFEWKPRAWSEDELRRGISDFELRTATTLTAEGDYRSLAFDEWNRVKSRQLSSQVR